MTSDGHRPYLEAVEGAFGAEIRCYNLASEASAMPEWLEYGIGIFVGAVAIMLLIKYRDRGILKRIGESKYQFRQWLIKWRSHI